MRSGMQAGWPEFTDDPFNNQRGKITMAGASASQATDCAGLWRLSRWNVWMREAGVRWAR